MVDHKRLAAMLAYHLSVGAGLAVHTGIRAEAAFGAREGNKWLAAGFTDGGVQRLYKRLAKAL